MQLEVVVFFQSQNQNYKIIVRKRINYNNYKYDILKPSLKVITEQ